MTPFAPHRRIGLLGGSFNPAHDGHVHLSMEAVRRLRLDAVVWLVSPQNPLKSHDDMAAYVVRLSHARELTRSNRLIHVSDYEQRHQLYYSIDTIRHLQQRFPACALVWLMGADNLACFHRWRSWQEMMQRIPIAVFDRAPFSHAALHQKAALRYRRFRLPDRQMRQLAHSAAPRWTYCFMPRHPLSATELRKTLGENAFL